jgi:hypothetical protein
MLALRAHCGIPSLAKAAQEVKLAATVVANVLIEGHRSHLANAYPYQPL